MQLDRIGIRPRLRSAWEAIDLGFVLARQWWRPLFLSWMVPSLILFLLLSALLPESWLWLSATIVWWLKPLWDTAPLYIASRALFGEQVTPAQAWRRLPKLLRWETLLWLSWRRFSFTRSTDMPVTVLEQLRGEQRSRRLNVLHQNIGNGAGWLTITCVHFEMILVMGLFGLLMLMLPDEVGFNPMEYLLDPTPVVAHISNAATFLAMTLVAPFYTMAGFALYISRRVELEAWDIEIRFRHLASMARAQRGNGIVGIATMALAGTLCAAMLTAPTAHAKEAAAAPQTEAQASAKLIDEILAGPDFHRTYTTRSWRFKDDDKEEPQDESVPEWLITFVEWLENRSDSDDDGNRIDLFSAASLIRFALWVVLISLFVYLIYRYRASMRQWLRLERPQSQRAAAPEILFGLDVRAASLPQDVLGEVMALWQSQQPRAALSLLYRAALAQLLERFALPFHDDHTEGECAAIVRAEAPVPVADYFGELTAVWQRLAYAHREPSSEQLQQLCTQWRQVFGADREVRA